MHLFQHILLKALLPISISSIAMVIVAVIVINSNLSSWTSDIGIVLEDAEIKNLNNRINGIQKLLQDTFIQITSDVNTFSDYTTYILSDSPSSNYQNYALLTSLDPSSPSSNLTASGFYESQGASTLKNPTSLVDDVFRLIYKSSPNYETLLLGFEDGFFRRYPFFKADNYPTLAYTCARTGQPIVGFTPQCRDWYELGRQNPGKVVYSDPRALASTGKIVITAVKALYNGSSFIGVVGGNIYMTEVDKIILEKVLDNGYNYIIDTNNILIFYPGLDRSTKHYLNEYEGITITDSSGTKTYTKNGDSWYIVYKAIPNSTYIACISVPWSDIQKSKIELDNQSKKTITAVIAVAVVMLVVLSTIGVVMSKKVSLKIIKPLAELTDFLDKLGKQDFKQKLVDPNSDMKEIQHVYNNFKDLFEALKFGNQAYHNGDWELALQNYDKIEQLMRRTDNQRGLGIVYSNKANTFRLVRKDNKALIQGEYQKAIDLAEQLMVTYKDKFDAKILATDLADRLMNYGVYFMELKDIENAKKFFDRAMQIHKSHDNDIGIAKTTGNLAQLLIECKEYEEAENLLSNLITYAEETSKNQDQTQRLLQYAYMNYGRLNIAKGKRDEAMICFTKSLDSAKIWDKQVAMICAHHLIEYYEKDNNTSKIGLIEEVFPNIPKAAKEKNVRFVLDTSGSMVNIISQCRASILEIVKKLNQNDLVSLCTFSGTITPIFDDLKIGTDYSKIIDLVETKTRDVSGSTAFYEAVWETMKKRRNENDWIIALTDGEDNQSKIKPEEINAKFPSYVCNLIVITVGTLHNLRQIESICKTAQSHKKVGAVLQTSSNLNEIAQTFSKAGDMMLRGDVVQQEL